MERKRSRITWILPWVAKVMLLAKKGVTEATAGFTHYNEFNIETKF